MTGQPAPPALKQDIIDQALAEGFAAPGFCRPGAIPEAAARLAAYVAEGRHGQMGWMAERIAWRGETAALWSGARAVVMLAEAYTPEHEPLAGGAMPVCPVSGALGSGRFGAHHWHIHR